MSLQPEPPRTPDGRPFDDQPYWRRDFPVETSRDQSVSRRDFAKFLVLTSGAFAAGQLWIAIQSWIRGARPAQADEAIIPLRDVPVGGSVAFRYGSDRAPCLLIRLDEATLVAYDQRCTHLACAVIPKVKEGHILCPCHQGFFDLRTGVPLAGPPRRPLPRVTLEVRDGMVYATGMERRV